MEYQDSFFLVDRWTNVTLEKLKEFAISLKANLKVPAIVFLEGEVGIGKTTLAKYFFEKANSPTYSIISSYKDGIHADFYRLKGAEEITHLELSLYANFSKYFLLEWGFRYFKEIFRELIGPFNYYLLEIIPGINKDCRNFTLKEFLELKV